MDEEPIGNVIPPGITSSWTKNSPEEWFYAGNYQPIDVDSDRQDQNARKNSPNGNNSMIGNSK
jgi:hypothetical protein